MRSLAKTYRKPTNNISAGAFTERNARPNVGFVQDTDQILAQLIQGRVSKKYHFIFSYRMFIFLEIRR